MNLYYSDAFLGMSQTLADYIDRSILQWGQLPNLGPQKMLEILQRMCITWANGVVANAQNTVKVYTVDAQNFTFTLYTTSGGGMSMNDMPSQAFAAVSINFQSYVVTPLACPPNSD